MNHRFTLTAALASAAASTSLLPLLAGGKWFGGGLGAIIIVALVGTATRQRALRGVPILVCLLCSLAALALYLNVFYGAKWSYLGVVPTGSSLYHLWHSAVTGMRETQKYAPPVPGIPGIDLVADAGIGLVAAVTDLIAVRLRRCALAGLPLLVLFSVPIATDAGKNSVENIIVFCLGMAGYLALLSADGRERLRLWGRLVTPWNTAGHDEPEDLGAGQSVRALAASGRRIGLAAVVLALFVPLLVPGLYEHKLFHGSGGGDGDGPGNGSGLPQPLAQMTGQLQEPKATQVLTYTSNVPANDPQNLQIYVLGKLTATNWVVSPPGTVYSMAKQAELPPVPGLTGKDWPAVHVTVQFSSNFSAKGESYLPMPYPARQVTVPGNWEVDSSTLMADSPSVPLTDLNYQVTSYNVDPTNTQLEAAPGGYGSMGAYLTVPKAFGSLRALAERVTRGAKSPGEKAVALQNWLRSAGGFSYSLKTASIDGASALSYFLNHSKKGYCQQFAFAMGVLARLLGIPSRVVVGYTAGRDVGQGHWVVMNSDAHAWPELYIRGYGWMSFEPTPSGDGVGQQTATVPAYTEPPGYTGPGTDPGVGGPGSAGSLPAAGAAGIRGPHRVNNIDPGSPNDNGLNADTKNRVGPGGGGSAAPYVQTVGKAPVPLFVLLGLILIALVTPRAVRSVTRRRRWRAARDNTSTAHAAWAELLDDLEDYGVRHGPSETPRALARRVVAQQRLPAAGQAALERVAQAEERASYAPEPGPATGLPGDVASVRSAIASGVDRRSRWRARLLPASGVRRTWQALGHTLDLFNWAELAAARAGRRLRRIRTREA